MALANELITFQFKNGAPNSYFGWGPTGLPFEGTIFAGATGVANGTVGLVPRPLLGQQDFVLHGDGTWRAGGGGGGSGNITGVGVAGRVPIWNSSTDLTNNTEFTYNGTTNVLKAPTVDLIRVSAPSIVTNGLLYYDSTTDDFVGRTVAGWLGFTRMDEIVLPLLTTTLLLNETHRNKIIRTTATTTVTITLSAAVSSKFTTTVVKGGTGDVAFASYSTLDTIGGANTIVSQNGGVTLYHTGSNNWRGYGAVGGAGTGSVSNIGVSVPSTLMSVTPTAINTSGTFTFSFVVQAPETVFMGPVRGAAAAVPTFRALTIDSLPLTAFADWTTTGNFTLNLTTHRGRVIDVSGTGAHVITLPNTGIPDGWYCNVWRGTSSGVISFTSSISIEAEALALNSVKTMATVIYRQSANKWMIIGKLS